jgi:hypothetical protein
MDANLEALYFIPFKASKVNVKNITIDFYLESTSTDKVHWQLVDKSSFSLSQLNITMENNFLNELVRLSRPVITKVVDKLLPKVSAAIDQQIIALNKLAANEGPYTFDLNAFGQNLALNMTMTTAPEVENDLTKIFFDGTFHAPNGTATPNFIKDYAPRFAHSHSNQFFIHQNTFNSLLNTA